MNRRLLFFVGGAVLWMVWLITSLMAFLELPVPVEIRVMVWLLVAAVAHVYVGYVVLYALGAKS